jgi:hypothetical protein
MMSTWNGMQMLEAYLLLAICHVHALIVHQSHLLTQENLQEVAAGPILEILGASKSRAKWFKQAAAGLSSIS